MFKEGDKVRVRHLDVGTVSDTTCLLFGKALHRYCGLTFAVKAAIPTLGGYSYVLCYEDGTPLGCCFADEFLEPADFDVSTIKIEITFEEVFGNAAEVQPV